MKRIFGTDGIRGIVGRDLTCNLCTAVARAGYSVLASGIKGGTFLIADDSRISASTLSLTLASGIMSLGGRVVMLGTVPTPALAYLVRYYEAQGGIMVSASHNSYEYNGIKFFDSCGFKLSDEKEDEISQLVRNELELFAGNLERPYKATDIYTEAAYEEAGSIEYRYQEGLDAYIEYLTTSFNLDLSGIKIAIDCANGATYLAGPRIYEALGAELVLMGDRPNGVNINRDCGSTKPHGLAKLVLSEGADLGLAFDGDGDRLIVIDGRGQVIDGDRTIAAIARHLNKSGSDRPVAVTVMSNLGLHNHLNSMGIKTLKTGVGDRYVLEAMKKQACHLGGEQSGHIIALEHSTTGDGILASLLLMSALKEAKGDRELWESLYDCPILPQVLVNARVKDELKYTIDEHPRLAREIENMEEFFGDRGRILVRASGTEPLVRVMLEGQDLGLLERMARELASMIEEEIGE